MPGDGKLDPEVTVDDVAGRSVDEDLGYPAHFAEGTGQRSLLFRRMRPPVSWVGH